MVPAVPRRVDGRDRAGARPAAHHRRRRRRRGAARRRPVHHRPRPRRAWSSASSCTGRAAALARPRLLRLPADPAVRGGLQPGGDAAHGTSGGASPRSPSPASSSPSRSPPPGVHLLGGLAWTIALLFGALIAATDPVSVVALFRRLGVSERLTTLVDAESLFNDGAAAVLFAVVARGGRRRPAPSLPGWAVGRSSGWRSAASSSGSPSATAPPGSTGAWTTTSSRSRSRRSSPTARSCSPRGSACPASWRA